MFARLGCSYDAEDGTWRSSPSPFLVGKPLDLGGTEIWRGGANLGPFSKPSTREEVFQPSLNVCSEPGCVLQAIATRRSESIQEKLQAVAEGNNVDG